MAGKFWGFSETAESATVVVLLGEPSWDPRCCHAVETIIKILFQVKGEMNMRSEGEALADKHDTRRRIAHHQPSMLTLSDWSYLES